MVDKRLEEIEKVLSTIPDPRKGIKYIMDRLSRRFPVIDINDDTTREAPRPNTPYDDEIERMYHPENFPPYESDPDRKPDEEADVLRPRD